MKWLCLLLIPVCFAQKEGADAEEQNLTRLLREGGASPIEFTRSIESHLAAFPNSSRRAELERALVKAAFENKDERRIVLYGERVLAREPGDSQLLERVARALLAKNTKDAAERALKYARREEESIAGMSKEDTGGRVSKGLWLEELDRALARSLTLQARANRIQGEVQTAVALADKSYSAFPTAEGAREMAYSLEKAGQTRTAVKYLADAFTINDPYNTEVDRAKDRALMGQLYRGVNGNEEGLGDIVLKAYDRTTALLAERRDRRIALDPNAELSNFLDFTLSGLKGEKLRLATLKGKAIVFDFWATWCGPCRVQHPLYEEVKQRFRDKPEVVFLSVSTDEDRSRVEPFLREQNWNQTVYFEDGLSKLLQISSIPTTLVVGKRGEVVSRMNGFLPDRFVDMLTERIREALKD